MSRDETPISNRKRQHTEQKPLHREVAERTREHISMRRNEQKLLLAARHVVLVTGQQRHKDAVTRQDWFSRMNLLHMKMAAKNKDVGSPHHSHQRDGL